ncbi:MAG: hypothetical protein JWP01_536 [Myxococcales bacterium]|nr:hypothetical protein [Myxococcales bacterium]
MSRCDIEPALERRRRGIAITCVMELDRVLIVAERNRVSVPKRWPVE